MTDNSRFGSKAGFVKLQMDPRHQREKGANASALSAGTTFYAFTWSPPVNIRRGAAAEQVSQLVGLLGNLLKRWWRTSRSHHPSFILLVAQAATYLPLAPSPIFTLMVMSPQLKAVQRLENDTRHVRQYSNLAKIAVIWNNQNLTSAEELSTMAMDGGACPFVWCQRAGVR